MTARAEPLARGPAFEAALLRWLNQRYAPAGPAIHADTPLFAAGLINSIRILELIAWTERAIGHEIEDSLIRTDHFGSVSRIAAMFAQDGEDA